MYTILCILLVWGCINFIKLSRFFSAVKFKKIYLFFCCWVLIDVCGLSLVVGSRDYSLVAVTGLLIVVASLMKHVFWHTKS